MKEKGHLTAAVTVMNWLLELPDKGFKATITQMIQQAITNFMETNERSFKILAKKQKL